MALRASFTLVAALYVRPAYAATLRNVPLRHRLSAVQPVSEPDYLRLALGQAFVYALSKAAAQLVVADLLRHILVGREHIKNRQPVAVAVHVQRFGQAEIAHALPLAPEMHQYFIFYTSAGISSKADASVRTVGIYPFYQPDRANGYEIINIIRLRKIFFHNMRHKAHIMFNKFIPRLNVALRPESEIFLLVLVRQRSCKRLPRRNAQHQQQAVHKQYQRAFQHKLTS